MIDTGRTVSCRVEPDEPLVCGEKATVTLYLSIQEEISAGGAVRLYFTKSPYYAKPPLYGMGVKGFIFFARIQFQADAPEAAGYVSATARSRRPVHIDVPGGKCFFTVVCEEGLAAGDELAVVIGDRSGGGAGADAAHHPTYVPAQIPCCVDREGNGDFVPQSELAAMHVVAAAARQVLVRVKPRVRVGAAADVQLMVADRFGNHVEGYEGTFAASVEGCEQSATRQLQLERRDDGVRCFPHAVAFERSGIGRVAVRSADADGVALAGVSNPVACRKCDDDGELFWGDLHGHSYCSDGTHSPEFYYRYGRDQGFLDFCALTDHDTFTPDVWEYVIKATAEAYEPGRFTTFLGYEWSGNFGQSIVVLFKNARGGYYPTYGEADALAEGFLRVLADEEVIISRHDMPAPGERWRSIDPAGKMERLVEIYSPFHTSETCRGPMVRGELDENNCVRAALADGMRVGFIGCSDSHLTMPGRRLAASKVPTAVGERVYGLTGVYARENTREALFSALYDRCCYAATDRILLDFRVNGSRMGRELRLNGQRRIEVHAAGTAPLEQVEIVKNDQVIHGAGHGAMAATFDYTDTAEIAPNDYYYVRVIQQDGGMAWASPVWVDPA